VPHLPAAEAGIAAAAAGAAACAQSHCAGGAPGGSGSPPATSAPQLAAMRPSAFLINIARGSLVDQEALAAALAAGAIAGAGLDVTDPEPLPRDHALLRCANLTLTPHVGTATRKTRVAMCRLALANLVAGLGLPPRAGAYAAPPYCQYGTQRLPGSPCWRGPFEGIGPADQRRRRTQEA
jgi:hypothetical protein